MLCSMLKRVNLSRRFGARYEGDAPVPTGAALPNAGRREVLMLPSRITLKAGSMRNEAPPEGASGFSESGPEPWRVTARATRPEAD